MNEYISRIENGNYELVIRCDDYKDFKAFESLIRDEMARNSNETRFSAISDELKNALKSAFEKSLKKLETEKECDSCKCKSETPKAGNSTKFNPMDVTMLNIGSKNDFGMMWSLLLTMLFLGSGNRGGYLKGKCGAYESISMPNKQEENMQKARDAFANLKKSIGELNKNNVSK